MATGDRVVRWVQFNAPVFVRVEGNENGETAQITKVIVVTDPDEMRPATVAGRTALVYDAEFNEVSDRGDTELDYRNRTAREIADDDRDQWPKEDMLGNADETWQIGPDPRQFTDYYLSNDELDEKYPDDEGA
ncbi:hypothetical protein [Nocardia sp. NPDC004415]